MDCEPSKEPSLNAHIFSFDFFSVCYVFVLFCSVLFFFFFLIFQADTSLFLFYLIVENLILHIFLIIMIIIPCSRMFRNVPGCSRMFHVSLLPIVLALLLALFCFASTFFYILSQKALLAFFLIFD